MSLIDKIQQAEGPIIATIVTAISGGIVWVIRKLIKIDMLEREMEIRDQRRKEDQAVLSEIKSDVKEIQRYLLESKK